MISLLLEQIDNADLIKGGVPNIEAVSKMTAIDIVEFADQSKELTSARDLPQQTGLLTHSASFSLGGSAWPCWEVECRIQKARELAQFAAFYSDKVYIRNFFVDHLQHLESEKYPNEPLMQNTFVNDLAVFQSLRPLIEAGIVIPIVTPHHCPHCFVQEILHQDDDKRLSGALEGLAKRYLQELNYSFYKDQKGLFNVVMEGPDDLLEHSYLAIVTSEPPPHYKMDRKFRKQVDKGEKIRLTKKIVSEMQLNIQLTDRVYQNVVFELAASQCLNTSYVTERDLEIKFLNAITTNKTVRARNQAIREHLTCIVPFINNISTADVLKLRNNEGEAFIRFRQALNKAVDESLSSGQDFTEGTARQLYQGVIRPELTNLDDKIHSARKTLLRDTAIKVGVWSAAIGIGLYTGIVPEGLAIAAKALGLTKVMADLGEAVLKKLRPESEIKGADMYFLWKVRQSAAPSSKM